MGLVESEDTVVLDCYRLADWYHQNPEVFLSMPLSDVRLHIRRTGELQRLRRERSGSSDE
jgi:hypothetical protein